MPRSWTHDGPEPPDEPEDPDSRQEGAVASDIEEQVQPPKMYRVLLHNDDYTTMEFVVMVLKSVFFHGEADAIRIMLSVHNRGVGIAGTYSFEIAETKAQKATQLARQHDFPLRSTVEPAE